MLGMAAYSSEHVRPALERTLRHDGPAVVGACRHAGARHAAVVADGAAGGFALYMAKAVLSGRGDELVDLARTKLFR